MSEDISKNTLMVLVVLTIVISLLGTWTVINEATKVTPAGYGIQAEGASTSSGRVTLSVVDNPEPVSATGQVTLSIV